MWLCDNNINILCVFPVPQFAECEQAMSRLSSSRSSPPGEKSVLSHCASRRFVGLPLAGVRGDILRWSSRWAPAGCRRRRGHGGEALLAGVWSQKVPEAAAPDDAAPPVLSYDEYSQVPGASAGAGASVQAESSSSSAACDTLVTRVSHAARRLLI